MQFTLSEVEAGQRVDVLVAVRLGVGRAWARRLCAEGRVRLDGRRVEKGAVGRPGAVLSIEDPIQPITEQNQQVALVEVHVDPWLVVVDKPAGQPSHPLRPDETATVAQALEARYPEMAGIGYGPREAGLVHRLDTGTSGLLVAARDAGTFQRLRALLVAGAIEKHYRALCTVPVAPGVLTGWLDARGPRVKVTTRAQPNTRPIRLDVLGCVEHAAGRFEVLVSVAHAGRHQVRAQLAAAGAPLVGDVQYGGVAVEGLDHHCLHASRLAFTHPGTGQALALASDPPWAAAPIGEPLASDGRARRSTGALPGRSAPRPRGG